MLASRRAASVASRHLCARAARSLRLYSESTAASPADDKPKSASNPNTTTSPPAAKPKPRPPPPAAAALSHSDVTYRPGPIGYHAPAEGPGEADAPELPQINWAQSYHGIAAQPVTERQFRMLTEPLDESDIEVKPDGVLYLPEIKYRRKLGEVFGPLGWGIIPKGEAVVGDSIVTREYALIINGRFVAQAQGENSYFSPEQLPSAVEGCKSNALMRCCKDIGIASELWDPHFVRWFRKNQMEEVWVEHATTKKKRTFWYKKGQVDVAYPYKLTK